MRWCLSFRVASFSSEFVLMMMRFLMREREFFGVRERERERRRRWMRRMECCAIA